MFAHFRNDLKDVGRLEHILLVFLEEGLGHYILQTKLRQHLPFHKQFMKTLPLENTAAFAIHLRHAFERLGPTFVKLGQLLSLRPDLVPQEICAELEKLQDHVPAVPFEQVKKIIEEELHQPWQKVFAKFERIPVACASIAQIHHAVLKSGKIVAVKVQRPGIREIIDKDLDILFHIAHSLEKHLPAARAYRPVEVVKEFAIWSRKELNFEIEARSAVRLRTIMKNNLRVKVPRIYPAYSSKRVLTMDFIEGVKINDLAALKRLRINPKIISFIYFNSILEQALLHGFFHADPHPANIFVDKSGKLVYLDYGIMGELTAMQQQALVRFIHTLDEGDVNKCLNLLLKCAAEQNHADFEGFKQETLPILEEAYHHAIGEASIGKAFYRIISLGTKYGVKFDTNLVLIAKAIYQAEGIGLKLNPQFRVADGFTQFAHKYLQERYSVRGMTKDLLKKLWATKEILDDLPEHLAKIVQRLEEPESHLEIEQLQQLENEWEYAERRKNTGLTVAMLVIAAVVLLYLEGRTQLFGVPLSILLFAFALLLVLTTIFQKPRREIYGTHH